jgi:hypothetical protein
MIWRSLKIAILLAALPLLVAATTVRFGGISNTLNVTPSNPTGLGTVGTDQMFGLSNQGGTQIGAFTPKSTGTVLIVFSGTANNTTSGSGIRAQLYYGTGTAPVNAAATTGTACGGRPTLVTTAATAQVSFNLVCIATGLTIGTAYWFDAAGSPLTSGTGQIFNLTAVAAEL